MYKEALKIMNDISRDVYVDRYLTGSYVITKKQEYKDIDFVVYTVTKKKLEEELLLFGFELCGKEGYPYSNVTAYRKGPCNIIIVTDSNVFLKWMAATLVAKELKAVFKQDRISIFNIILGEQKATPKLKPIKVNQVWVNEMINILNGNPNKPDVQF